MKNPLAPVTEAGKTEVLQAECIDDRLAVPLET